MQSYFIFSKSSSYAEYFYDYFRKKVLNQGNENKLGNIENSEKLN